MALYVCHRRTAGPSACLGASWRHRTHLLAAKGKTRPNVADLAAIRETFLQGLAPQNNPKFFVHAGFDLRPVGRNGIRSRCGDGACGSGREGRTSGGAARFARDHACFFCDDSGVPGHAVARGKTRAARRIGIFFRADGCLHRADVWKNFLSWRSSASLVFCLSFLSWFWWHEFCGLHAVASGAIPDGMPGARFRVFHVLCAIWRSGNHVSGWRWSTALRIAGNSRGADVHRLRHWPAPHSLWHGNPRADLAGVEFALDYDEYD